MIIRERSNEKVVMKGISTQHEDSQDLLYLGKRLGYNLSGTASIPFLGSSVLNHLETR